jgi:hypothetical protein
MGRGEQARSSLRSGGEKASFSCFHRPAAVAAAASRATQFASRGRLLCANYLLSLSKELSNAQIFAAPFLLCLPRHTPSPFGINLQSFKVNISPGHGVVSSRRLEQMSSSLALINTRLGQKRWETYAFLVIDNICNNWTISIASIISNQIDNILVNWFTKISSIWTWSLHRKLNKAFSWIKAGHETGFFKMFSNLGTIWWDIEKKNLLKIKSSHFLLLRS